MLDILKFVFKGENSEVLVRRGNLSIQVWNLVCLRGNDVLLMDVN